jgi:hypothetical protein
LRAELAVTHNLKERMLLCRRDKPRAALRILPNDGEFSGKSRARGGGLEGSVYVYLAGFRKRDQQGGSLDIQMCDRNRII